MYLAYCGLNCGECAVYLASVRKDTAGQIRLADEYSTDTYKFSNGHCIINIIRNIRNIAIGLYRVSSIDNRQIIFITGVVISIRYFNRIIVSRKVRIISPKESRRNSHLIIIVLFF